MKRVVIIDDEPDAIEILKLMLQTYCPEVEITGVAGGVEAGYKLICRESPDIVFLDIRMEDGSGFDLLNKFKKIKFKTIFTTAFEEYAVNAFRYHVLDYLLKPIDAEALVDAIARASEADADDYLEKIKHLKADQTATGSEKLAVHTKENIILLNTADIVRAESESNYARIYLTDKRQIMLSRSLSSLEERLPNDSFLRVHQSHIVNLDYVTAYAHQDNFITMSDDTKITVSRRKKNALSDWFDKAKKI